jgi:hypothetical protein
MTLARLLAIGSPPGETSGNRPIPVPTDFSESPVRTQASDVSIPSRFFASENGSSQSTQVKINGHDSYENLSWYDRNRLELARQGIEQGAQSLAVSKQSLLLGKVAFAVSLVLGVPGLIMAGIGLSKKSDGQSADDSSSG